MTQISLKAYRAFRSPYIQKHQHFSNAKGNRQVYDVIHPFNASFFTTHTITFLPIIGGKIIPGVLLNSKESINSLGFSEAIKNNFALVSCLIYSLILQHKCLDEITLADLCQALVIHVALQ